MSEKVKKILTNIVKVGLSNVITVISGVIVGFLLPKLIGVTNYGYYKTFSLYITYVGLFQFGIAEGIYLKFGGVDYSSLDKKVFRYYSQFFILLEFIVSLFFVISSISLLENEYAFIFACTSLFVLFQNVTTYYQYISQITNRFDELSIRNVIKSVLTIISVLGMWFYSRISHTELLSYKIYTILYVLIFAILMIWYVYTYRDITFGIRTIPTKDSSVFSLVKLGAPLLLSNMCGTLALSVDRQFVSILFDIDTYGSYAFAYNLISLITVATSSIGVVIYPQIKRTQKEKLLCKYEGFCILLIGFVMACNAVYFPLTQFMHLFFSDNIKYLDALPIFRILLPSLAITCTIGILIHTYYKAFELNEEYFKIVVLILVLSIIANILAYRLYSETSAISIASVIVFAIWFVIVNIFLEWKIGVKWKKSFVYLIAEMILFYIISSFNIWWVGFIVFLLLFSITSISIVKKDILGIFNKE